MAVAVEPVPGGAAKGRAIVIGDSEFCTNTQLGNVGNADFTTNLAQWLLNRENLISLPAKTPEQIQLHLSSKTLARFFWTVVFGMPAAWLLAGFLVYLRRRV